MASDVRHERALEALARIEHRLAAGDVELPPFSERELAACALEERGRRLVPLPSVDDAGEAEYAAALTAGRDALVERGYLDPDAEDGDEPVGELALIAVARAVPSLVAIVDRFDGRDERASRYLFGVGPAAVLEERPEPDGIHGFTLRSLGSAATALADFVDPRRRATRDGEPHRFSTDGSTAAQPVTELERRIATASVVARVFVTRGSEQGAVDEDFSVATLDDGLWVVAGRDEAAAGRRTVGAREVSRATLHALLVGCLGPG